ncbi:MAG: hypothetical protein DCC71_01065 [Proteobacteria bacterium]|nr:MAG: hypothetical protein DCC71_01065 [Pseudomonadota bacterium]
MTFGELQNLLEDEARRGATGIRILEGLGTTLLRVTVETVPGRLHGVWIAWEGDGDGELARVVAPAAPLPKDRPLAAEASHALLQRNATLNAGALAIVSIDGRDYVALVVPLRLAEIDPAAALLALVRAANAADAFEEALGGDEL